MSHEPIKVAAASAAWPEQSLVEVRVSRLSSDFSKRAFDVTVASAIMLVFLPLFAIICLALLTQGRPILIRHKRLGKNGNLFPCLKFRTMVVNAEEILQRHLTENFSARVEWATSRKLKDDPRVTALGRVLRKSSVDELPQLFNVLRGDMSLVGPRPIVPAEAVHYGVHIDTYHAVRPGLTGAWQISGRSDLSYNQRVTLDCHYVNTRTLLRDVGIMVMTIPAVLKSRGSY